MPGITAGKTWSRIGAETATTGGQSGVAPGVWGDLNEIAELVGAETWPTPKAGSYEYIASTAVTGGGVYSFEFTSIPQTYATLELRMVKGYDTAAETLAFKTNGAANNYPSAYMYVDGNDSWGFGGETGNWVASMRGNYQQAYSTAMGVMGLGNYAVSSYLPVGGIGAVAGGTGDMAMTVQAYTYNSSTVVTTMTCVLSQGTEIPEGTIYSLFGILDAT